MAQLWVRRGVTVRIENTYSDGHESMREAMLPAPNGALDEWWQEVAFPETGDGHGIEGRLGSCYTATIIKADNPALVGLSEEWTD